MKKLNKLGYIAFGMILTLIIGTATPVFAAATKDVVKKLTAYFTSGGKPISLYVNGVKIDKDANGKAVTLFTVDGTTYVPVKAIGAALGKSVTWDAATASVKIDDKITPTPTPAPTSDTSDNNNAKLTITKKDGVIHESLGYTFTLDKDAVGEWKTVNFCKEISDFNPDQSFDGNLWYTGNSIYTDGTMTRHRIAGSNKVDDTDLHWTKGYFVDLMKSSNLDVVPAYKIQQIKGKTYMFVEWKSAYTTKTGEIEGYYVFEKVSDTPAPKASK